MARALIKDPRILVLDDCLSAVDTNTEARILSNLKRVMKDKTAFIISHRVSSVKDAGHIVVIDAGRVVEAGTHTELLALNRRYAEIYRVQLSEESLISY
jgi:ATP-binding cassette subfamily B protein